MDDYNYEEDEEFTKTTFESWIHYTFEMRLIEDSPPYDWNKDIEWYDFDFNKQLEMEYIARLFASPVESTKNYSAEQTKVGLRYLITEMDGDLYELFNQDISLELRIQVVKDMYTVFEQLFAPRCTPKLCQYAKSGSLNPLNSICFMWWDIIMLYGKSGEPHREIFDSYCIDVMEQTLRLESIACQEAALHGLGHWNHAYPERIKKIIEDFLERTPDIDPDLHEYALAAHYGMVL